MGAVTQERETRAQRGGGMSPSTNTRKQIREKRTAEGDASLPASSRGKTEVTEEKCHPKAKRKQEGSKRNKQREVALSEGGSRALRN